MTNETPSQGQIWQTLTGRERYVEIVSIAAAEVTIRTVKPTRPLPEINTLVWMPKTNRQTKAQLSRFNGKNGGYRFYLETKVEPR